jgi:Met-zincin/Domain of unknown function (DUF5117)/Domain of unknown function (DUF5118)
MSPHRSELSLAARLIACTAALGVAGCATSMAAPDPAAAAPAPKIAVAAAAVAPAAPAAPAAASAPARAASAAAPAVAPPAPGQPPAFATVIKDAKRSDGFVPFWRKDEKLWLELPAALIDQPLMYSVNVSRSVGERGLHGAQMGPNWLAKFVKSSPTQVQLRAINAERVADGKARQAALAEAFSESLLASMPVASAAHPESKAVLLDASFLLNDIASYARFVEGAFRIPYAPDRGNSHIGSTYANEQATTVNTTVHFAVPRLPLPPTGPVPPGIPLPTPPSTLADARSFLVGFVHNFAKLPEKPMAPRRADGRIGHFYDVVTDYGNDKALRQRVAYINRWRLEKKDPAAAVSEPVKPITFWLDKNIPPEYRASVAAGVLEWNKAFEKIGLKNAVVTQQQPDDADWDTLDPTHASLRWYFIADAGASASGPSHSDPRSGEILDADIAIGDGWTRAIRREAVEETVSLEAHEQLAALASQWRGGAGAHRAASCGISHAALAEMQFSLDVLVAQGVIAPNSAEAEAYVQDYLKWVVMHEVGHTLGLKHNFKASTVFTDAQLRDPAFTAANGTTGSVMDYVATNLPLPGERRSSLLMAGLGPYDYWAIEYAYRPLDAATEAAELERIASRSTEPLLAFADDADADGFGAPALDPLVTRFDLGADPLAYFERRLALTQDLWKRAATWKPLPDEGAQRQRGMLGAGFTLLRLSAQGASKLVGGMHASREVP